MLFPKTYFKLALALIMVVLFLGWDDGAREFDLIIIGDSDVVDLGLLPFELLDQSITGSL